MPERIDHYRKANKALDIAQIFAHTAGSTDIGQIMNVLVGQVEATLALVEQQRIANLIALANSKNPILSEQVASDAATALIEHHPSEYGGWFELTPDIAAALGIKQGGESK